MPIILYVQLQSCTREMSCSCGFVEVHERTFGEARSQHGFVSVGYTQLWPCPGERLSLLDQSILIILSGPDM